MTGEELKRMKKSDLLKKEQKKLTEQVKEVDELFNVWNASMLSMNDFLTMLEIRKHLHARRFRFEHLICLLNLIVCFGIFIEELDRRNR